MPETQQHYEDLVSYLIHNHAHSESEERRAVVQKGLSGGLLDFDQAGEVIDDAADELDFVHTAGNLVWYEQNESMILYVRDETEMQLEFVGTKFSHLTPPELRDKYGIPTTRR